MKKVKLALSFYGLREIPGEGNNPNIMAFFKEIGHTWVKDDETAWCSAFLNWICMKTNFEGSGKLNARSWLEKGHIVDIEKPELGDVTVLWRVAKTDWRGHVGLYINHDSESVWLLGGNQNNSVCIKPYPVDRILGHSRMRNLV